MIELKVYGIGIDQTVTPNQPLLFLTPKADPKPLKGIVTRIGPAEAMAIQLALEDKVPPRPLSHDLTVNILFEIGAKLESVMITSIGGDDIYFAGLAIEYQGTKYFVDARPSDAVALALRASAHIYIDPDLFKETATLFCDKPANEHGENLLSPEEQRRFQKLVNG